MSTEETELASQAQAALRLEEELDDIDTSRWRLEKATEHLGRFGLAIATTTAAQLLLTVVSFLSVGPPPLPGEDPSLAARLALAGVLLTGFASLTLVFFYERLRRRGDALFEELSTELGWLVRAGGEPVTEAAVHDEGPREKAPSHRLRLALRSYTHEVGLPLVPARQGVGMYAFANLALVLLVAFAVVFG